MTAQRKFPAGARRGFAVPAALLTILVLTVSIAAGFSIATAERRSTEDQKAQITAFQLAEEGLEIFLIKRDSLGFLTIPPGAKDSVRITLTGGYADVQLDRIRAPQGSLAGLYVIRSRGVQTNGAFAGTPMGVRTVAQYALWEPASMQVLAGWTAMSGFQKNGNSGTLGGVDACGDSAAVAGVAVPVPPGYSGKTGMASGDPPIDTVTINDVHIDWNGIVNGSVITPTITIPPGAWPSFTDTSYYPVIRVNGDISLPSTGRGTLIVTGNLTISGIKTWHGVMLVGGEITSNGNNGGGDTLGVAGATVSGLNVKLGMTVAPATANGTKTYRYSSCEVAKAMAALGALIPLPNTWVDNWVEYN